MLRYGLDNACIHVFHSAYRAFDLYLRKSLVDFIQKYDNILMTYDTESYNNLRTNNEIIQKDNSRCYFNDNEDDGDEFNNSGYWLIYKKFMESPCVKCFYDVVSNNSALFLAFKL